METNNITKSELRGMIREWWYNTKKNRMTESRLRGVIQEAVKRVLMEENLPEEDGELEYACHKATISSEDEPEMAKIADKIYDRFSHNEMDVQEVIDAVLDYGVEYNDEEESVIPSACHKLGTSDDGRYILTYESFTGTYDVWEKRDVKESRLRGMIHEAVKQSLKEAENNGWVVEDDDAWEAYEFACDRMGKETVDNAIIRALSYKQLAECLAYIFRMYDFDEWNEYNSEGEEPEYDEEY